MSEMLTDDPEYFPSTEYERGYADGRAAIEAEARASQPLTLDVERLADAVAAALPVPSMLDVDFADRVAVDIAGEYERLGKP